MLLDTKSNRWISREVRNSKQKKIGKNTNNTLE